MLNDTILTKSKYLRDSEQGMDGWMNEGFERGKEKPWDGNQTVV